MKKFDFRRQLKGMSVEQLEGLKDYHLDWMIKFIGFDDKSSAKHFRYVGYIEDAIKRLNK